MLLHIPTARFITLHSTLVAKKDFTIVPNDKNEPLTFPKGTKVKTIFKTESEYNGIILDDGYSDISEKITFKLPLQQVINDFCIFMYIYKAPKDDSNLKILLDKIIYTDDVYADNVKITEKDYKLELIKRLWKVLNDSVTEVILYKKVTFNEVQDIWFHTLLNLQKKYNKAGVGPNLDVTSNIFRVYSCVLFNNSEESEGTFEKLTGWKTDVVLKEKVSDDMKNLLYMVSSSQQHKKENK